MTPQDFKRVKYLMTLADVAADLEFVDVNLVSHFHAMREDIGLAKLLLLIQDYAQRPSVESKPTTEAPKTSEQDKDKVLV